MQIDKRLILNNLKQYKNFASDAEFARFIGVTPTVLSNWLRRNTFNIDKIVNAFPEVQHSWLLTGEGEMLKSAKNSFGQIPEERIEELIAKALSEKLIELYNAGEIYPSAVHNRIIAEKEKRIEELQRENWELQLKIKELQ